MYGYQEKLDRDEVKTWSKDEYNESDLATLLLPNNVAPEEAIRRVLMCHPPGTDGFAIPLPDLLVAWRVTCPDYDLESLVDKAGQVCVALQSAANKKARPQSDDSEN